MSDIECRRPSRNRQRGIRTLKQALRVTYSEAADFYAQILEIADKGGVVVFFFRSYEPALDPKVPLEGRPWPGSRIYQGSKVLLAGSFTSEEVAERYFTLLPAVEIGKRVRVIVDCMYNIGLAVQSRAEDRSEREAELLSWP
ncbi:hypothetical protein [Actinomadura harenae]|uniref:hypothetical protein n=1 Tax=Actinomadura harenae TaxID=2483351 RepID=UPI0011C49161|nr:hypothetical protein [Actinomadura harenae]